MIVRWFSSGLIQCAGDRCCYFHCMFQLKIRYNPCILSNSAYFHANWATNFKCSHMQVLSFFSGRNSESFDISHAFLPLAVAKLSTLKTVRIWPTLYIWQHRQRRTAPWPQAKCIKIGEIGPCRFSIRVYRQTNKQTNRQTYSSQLSTELPHHEEGIRYPAYSGIQLNEFRHVTDRQYFKVKNSKVFWFILLDWDMVRLKLRDRKMRD